MMIGLALTAEGPVFDALADFTFGRSPVLLIRTISFLFKEILPFKTSLSLTRSSIAAVFRSSDGDSRIL